MINKFCIDGERSAILKQAYFIYQTLVNLHFFTKSKGKDEIIIV